MLLTEDEARTKWCPMARLAETPGSYNRCGPAASLQCIASDCMMWRAGKLDNEFRAFIEPPSGEWLVAPYDADKDPTRSRVWYRLRSDNRDKGFCGLAGESQ